VCICWNVGDVHIEDVDVDIGREEMEMEAIRLVHTPYFTPAVALRDSAVRRGIYLIHDMSILDISKNWSRAPSTPWNVYKMPPDLRLLLSYITHSKSVFSKNTNARMHVDSPPLSL